MFFRKRKAKQLEQEMLQGNLSQDYWAAAKRRFYKNRAAVWSLRIVYALLIISLLADFLANERPLACKLDGKTFFPVFKQYAVDLGLDGWDAQFVTKDWTEHDFDWVVWPPIPYSPSTLDKKNTDFQNPVGNQRVESIRFWHWLGTDQIGRDVAAGMIAGTRTAMIVGLSSMFVAGLIGIFFGSLAGYFGDDRLKLSVGRVLMNIIALPLAVFYGFIARSYILGEGHFLTELTKSIGIFIGILLLANLFAFIFRFIPGLNFKWTLPVDLLVMRLIEIVNSIPALLLILSMVALIEKPSILYVVLIIGLIRWTGIARFIRSELLRIRSLEYIEAARALGFSNLRIIFRHALPNALTPVLITIAFGIASAILIEAFLSFLGIGVPIDAVTWGSMLSEARSYFPAWWLAIFPGFAIFITVTAFNLLGEGLTDAFSPKSGSKI